MQAGEAQRLLGPASVPSAGIHYKEWYELLKAAGHEVAGKDPLANFLAHIARAPEVERMAPRSGVYRLRAA